MISPEQHANIEKNWTNHTLAKRSRWWQSQTIRKHIAKTICGKDFEGTNWCLEMLKRTKKNFNTALSIGCGIAMVEPFIILP